MHYKACFALNTPKPLYHCKVNMVRCKFTVDLKPYRPQGKKRQISPDSAFFSYRINGILPTAGQMSPSLRRAIKYHQLALSALNEEMDKADLLSFARTFSEVRTHVSPQLNPFLHTT